MSKDTQNFPKVFLSQEGMLQNFDIKDGRNFYWTDDKNVELPIRVREGDTIPIRTIPEVFYQTKKTRPDAIAFK